MDDLQQRLTRLAVAAKRRKRQRTKAAVVAESTPEDSVQIVKVPQPLKKKKKMLSEKPVIPAAQSDTGARSATKPGGRLVDQHAPQDADADLDDVDDRLVHRGSGEKAIFSFASRYIFIHARHFLASCKTAPKGLPQSLLKLDKAHARRGPVEES